MAARFRVSATVAMRILWMSDSPTAFTGFGTVTREILGRLAGRPGYEVASLGWGYDGWPYDRDELPYDIYPSAGQPFGRDSAPRALAEFEPDVLVSFGDLWMIDWTRELDSRGRFEKLIYFPVDGEPFPRAWKKVVQDADIAVAYSLYGQRLTREACPETDIHMIYHGVDVETFRPLPDKEMVKERNGLGGKFVVGCVARNQPRKHLPLLIEAFARFCADKGDAMLYLHTDPNDIGWDVLELLRHHGVSDRTSISRFASVDRGVSSEDLNIIYNLFDVMALPTAAEGFGLPILEAMAAGVPVVATGFSACVELVEGRGELIEVKDHLTIGRYNLKQALPDVEDLVHKLDLLYSEPKRRARHRTAALKFAHRLRWERILEEWDALLTRTPATAARGSA